MFVQMAKMVNHLSPMEMNVDTSFRIESPEANQFSISDLDNFLSSSVQDGRESLGILSLDFQNTSNFLNVTFGRESLNPHSDLGRESLGIINLDQLTFNLATRDDISPVLLSPVPTHFNFTRILDTGFLLTPTKYSNSSFNSNSLEFPSKIFVLTKSDNSISSPVQSLLNNAQIMTSPNVERKNQKEFFWSTGKPIKSNLFTNKTYHSKLKFEDDKDDLFLDSVFIEGNHLAQKIADGSFIHGAPDNINLDSTPQPDWPDFDESEQKSPKVNSEMIHKAIDKMFPATSQTDDFKIKTSRSDSASSSKSREAKDILNNLSEIFNNSHRSEKQKSDGRMLLNNLVELLNNSQYIHDGEDSGHSSNLENESIDKGVTHSSDKKFGNESGPKKQLSQSFGPVKSTHLQAERRSSVASGYTSHAKVINKQNSPGIKLKSKPVKVVPRKGPLIAVIPVEDMKKTNASPNTSNKEQKMNLNLQMARTSTPVNEPKLKPSFTSTPRNTSSKTSAFKPKLTSENSFDSNNSNDGSKKPTTSNMSRLRKTSETSVDSNNSNDGSKKPTTSNMSRLRKTSETSVDSNNSNDGSKKPTTTSKVSHLRRMSENSIGSNNSNDGSKKPNTSKVSQLRKTSLTKGPLSLKAQIQSGPVRRNTVSEGMAKNIPGRARSNSLGKESGLMSVLPTIRKNLLKSPYCNKNSGILSERNAKVESTEVTFKVANKSKNKENLLP